VSLTAISVVSRTIVAAVISRLFLSQPSFPLADIDAIARYRHNIYIWQNPENIFFLFVPFEQFAYWEVPSIEGDKFGNHHSLF
jgi:hypothetical protein